MLSRRLLLAMRHRDSLSIGIEHVDPASGLEITNASTQPEATGKAPFSMSTSPGVSSRGFTGTQTAVPAASARV